MDFEDEAAHGCIDLTTEPENMQGDVQSGKHFGRSTNWSENKDCPGHSLSILLKALLKFWKPDNQTSFTWIYGKPADDVNAQVMWCIVCQNESTPPTILKLRTKCRKGLITCQWNYSHEKACGCWALYTFLKVFWRSHWTPRTSSDRQPEKKRHGITPKHQFWFLWLCFIHSLVKFSTMSCLSIHIVKSIRLQRLGLRLCPRGFVPRWGASWYGREDKKIVCIANLSECFISNNGLWLMDV